MEEHAHRPVDAPSPWVGRCAALVAPGARLLDLACGGGRHARLFAARGCAVEAVDRDAAALAALSGVAGVTTRCADLEGGAWPYGGQRFQAVVVVNYLHRPLFPLLAAALDDGGVLIYETFMQGNERHGKPANPAFLLRAGELLEAFGEGFAVLAFEQGEQRAGRLAVMQRICAVKGGDATRLALP